MINDFFDKYPNLKALADKAKADKIAKANAVPELKKRLEAAEGAIADIAIAQIGGTKNV